MRLFAMPKGSSQKHTLQSLLVGSAMLVTLLTPALAAAQDADSQRSAAEPRPLTFDVVSIKRNISGDGNVSIYSPTDGDGLNLTNVVVEDIIAYAYGIHSPDLLQGLPAWAKSVHFDIQAKVTGAEVPRFRSLNEEQRRQMIQSLLADRFKLKIHRELKTVGVYALVVDKSGIKMKEVKPGDPHPGGIKEADGTPIEGPALNGSGPDEETAQEITMDFFAGSLSGPAGRQVVDKTGLKGMYDFKLRFSRGPDAAQTPASPNDTTPASDASAPSIFIALQEQLGLKLEPQKLSTPILVIDDVQRPLDD